MGEPLAPHDNARSDVQYLHEYQDMIHILQEEITRLEDELRLRDLAAEGAEAEQASVRSRRTREDELRIRAEHERVDAALGAELANRDETIALLLEQIRLADEAEAAARAEWEQLHQWVAEVEKRIADQQKSGAGAGATAAAEIHEAILNERRSAESLRQMFESQRRSWELERQSLGSEVERLRARLVELADGPDASAGVIATLERENQELRAAYRELADRGIPAHDLESIVAELQAARQERDLLSIELRQQRDDHERARMEHQAAENALRSQLARESLRRQEEQVRTTAVLSGAPSTVTAVLNAGDTLDPDQRIRAFREHLKEIHHEEAEQRLKRGLAARLSRLWSHTGPDR